MKTFKPYNEAEIQRGADILMKVAKGDVPDKTILNYLKALEEGSGQFKGAGNLTGKVPVMGKSVKQLKETFDIAKFNLLNATDLKIANLTKEMVGLQARGIELGQRAEKLKELLKWRRIILASVFGSEILRRFKIKEIL